MKVSTLCKSDGCGYIGIRVCVKAKTIDIAKFLARDYFSLEFQDISNGICFVKNVSHNDAFRVSKEIRTQIRLKAVQRNASIRSWNRSVKYRREQKLITTPAV